MASGCVAQTSTSKKSTKWIFDCGATDTMTYDRRDLVTCSVPLKSSIQNANGGVSPVYGAGTVEFSPSLKLKNCLYVPSLSWKLLSISHVSKELNCVVLMFSTFCLLQDIQSGKVIGRGTERDGLYYVDEVAQRGTATLAHGTVERQRWLWHRRLGHPSVGYLHLLFPQLFSSTSNLDCETCLLSKSHKHSYVPSNKRSESVFSLVHSDVWGPAPHMGSSMNNSGFQYFILFIDDCSRLTWVYFLKHKSEVFSKFVEFYNMILTQFQSWIQILRSDNGGEYVNNSMKKFCSENGVIHQTSCSYTPQQNGVAERKNRIILEMARALMLESKVPTFFWPEAVATAIYLLNRLPTKILHKQTPLQELAKHVQIPSTLVLQP